MTLLLVLAVFCLACAAFLVGEIVTAPSRQRYVSVRRAAAYGRMEMPSGTPHEGFHERVVAPLSDVLSKWALKVNPRSSKDAVERRLMASGLSYRISPTGYLALKALLARTTAPAERKEPSTNGIASRTEKRIATVRAMRDENANRYSRALSELACR